MEEQARLGNFNVSFTNLTESLSCVSVAGPKSRDILSQLTKTDLDDAHFPFLTYKEIEVAGVKASAMRISYTGVLIKQSQHNII